MLTFFRKVLIMNRFILGKTSRWGFLVMLFIISCSSPSVDDYSPFLEYQAKIHKDTLISTAFPAGSISFNTEIEYIGSETFILYNVARCEIHLFAKLDSQGAYKRIYWIQYEGYLPKNLLPFPLKLKPGGPKYNYSQDPYKSEIAGKQFHVRPGTFPIEFTKEEIVADSKKNDSDFLHVARLLYQNGIDINGEVLSVRMVHLDSLSKNELMIIYYESLKKGSPIHSKLDNKGKESPEWKEISKALQERAINGISIDIK